MVKMAFRSSAVTDLNRIDRSLRKGLLQGCRDIFDDWTIGKRLSGKLAGLRAHRISDYRILYKVQASVRVEIVAIGHREEIYDRMEKGG